MRKPRNLVRKIQHKDRRAKFVLIMEGRNTEPEYFIELSRKNPSIIVDIELVKGAGVPKTISEKAAESRNIQTRRSYIKENGDKDQVWAVFDRDEHPNYQEALQRCKDNDVRIAQSNPCFELWLILHFEDYDRDEHRHLTQARCEEICPGYTSSKRKIPDLSSLVENVLLAEARAEAQLLRRDRDAGEAPKTTVFLLTRALRGH